MTPLSPATTQVRLLGPHDLTDCWPRWEAFADRLGLASLSYHPAWLAVLARGLDQEPYCLEAVDGGETVGLLPLSFLRGPLFGRFLVGYPYLNYGGVLAVDDAVAGLLIDRAIDLADRLDVRYLELRHERAVDHPRLVGRPGGKIHMRLPLPTTPGELWDRLAPKVRNQVRKGQKSGLDVAWGGEQLLPDFYNVFSRNMRDLGTPAFGRSLFREAARQFPDRVEFCVLRSERRPVAAAFLAHGRSLTEVPSASSLREFNPTCCNMLLYWLLLERSIARGQSTFDFGRSSPGSGTYQFKKQWGAAPEPADWQYYVRSGSVSDMRPDHPRYRKWIRIWQRLPVPLTRWIGPAIVRGIP